MTDFYIITRRTGNRPHYYARFFDSADKTNIKEMSLSAVAKKLGLPKTDTSVGNRAKAREMEALCRRAVERGVVSVTPVGITLAQYGLDFWDWSGRRITLANKKNPGSIGKGYAHDMRQKFKTHIIPLLPLNCRLADVNSSLVNRIQDKLVSDGKLSNATVEKTMRSLTTLLNEAQRKDLIQHRVAVDKINTDSKKTRGILTMSEVAQMMKALAEEERRQVRDDTARLAIALAVTTGMREGEIRALKIGDINIINQQDSIVTVDESFSDYEHFKTTKGKRVREVACPTVIATELIRHAQQNPDAAVCDGIVFWSGKRGRQTGKFDQPVSKQGLLQMLYHALELIGIDENTRRQRNIVFHSLRHGYVSSVRTRVDDTLARLVIGHRDEKTSDIYTHVQYDTLKPIAAEGRRILSEIGGDDEGWLSQNV